MNDTPRTRALVKLITSHPVLLQNGIIELSRFAEKLEQELAEKNAVLDYIWGQVQDPNELNDTWFGGKDAAHTLATIVSNIDDKLRRVGYVNTEVEDE